MVCRPSTELHEEIRKEFAVKGDNGWTVLMSAAEAGNLEIVKLLLKKGAHVNARTEKGWTALM